MKIVIGIFRLDQIDRIHDHNTAKFIECIQTSHDVCGTNNLVAIKVTALIRPSVLKKLNIILKSLKDRSLLPSLFELINQEQSNEKIVTVLQSSLNEKLVSTDLTEISNLLIRLNKIAQVRKVFYSIMINFVFRHVLKIKFPLWLMLNKHIFKRQLIILLLNYNDIIIKTMYLSFTELINVI